ENAAVAGVKTVLVTGASLVPPVALDLVRARGYEVRHLRRDHFTPDELHRALAGAAGYLIGGYEEPTAGHFEAARELEAVAWVGTDFQSYVPGWRRAMELGVAFVNAPGANAVSVAEFTMLLVLAMARPFVAHVVGAGHPGSEPLPPGRELSGGTL